MKKKINIAIIGLGNIGSYLYSYLIKNKKQLTKKNRCIPNVHLVCAKNKKKKRNISIPKSKWANNYLDIVNDRNVDLIVELIGGAEGVAKKLVFSALKNRKHVVTANKALIAKYGDELSSIAEKNKVNLEFEASVCGGVPIIRSLKEGLIANQAKNFFSSCASYSINKHRHMAELDQELKISNYVFNPHIIPTFRGILSSIYIDVKNNKLAKKIYIELKRFYKNKYFVNIKGLNKSLGTNDVLNTNKCEITINMSSNPKKIIIFSAIDNLIKGAAGQAIQNMNLIYKFKENEGLR